MSSHFTQVPTGARRIHAVRQTRNGQQPVFTGFVPPNADHFRLRDPRDAEPAIISFRDLLGDDWGDVQMVRRIAAERRCSVAEARQWLAEVIAAAGETACAIETCNTPSISSGLSCPDLSETADADDRDPGHSGRKAA